MSRTADARRDCIYQRVLQDGTVDVATLAGSFGVTPQTVRQDLAHLEALGLVMRTHGGAKVLFGAEVEVGVKTASHAHEKLAIAREAIKLVGDGDVVWMDCGSTVLALARLLPLRRDITVATNSIRVAGLAATQGDCAVVLAGGEVVGRAGAATGGRALELAREVCADIVFAGCDGFDGRRGPTMTSPEMLAVTREAMAHASRRVLLADSSKFSRRGSYLVAPCEEFTYLITERLPPEDAWAGEAFAEVISAAG
ncbi:MAG: DeoR/GlpR family DNA-binding transcription regulator [Atopobiaceae bacterium]|nr:DeoR/GlpR family DNA-binding transcription regulator [Atopobiaceae bacterium]MCH4181220.1 DeoR/GlpR family DNA-binding transcription regulator [Atopobiaceae bacterium]MCH4214648.1 DeoR/GlpR family DNA-binding transcription regulator [Atopobiaceae bacterium]MCH4230145.1 DeoR/GlpR family DNA-binding transcription regulator [Atopobiaceae bacterium]MCH4275757.1 DeoR/GlpR family DNA-binding transcription regulator [Atopobiaceae bacterium]